MLRVFEYMRPLVSPFVVERVRISGWTVAKFAASFRCAATTSTATGLLASRARVCAKNGCPATHEQLLGSTEPRRQNDIREAGPPSSVHVSIPS